MSRTGRRVWQAASSSRVALTLVLAATALSAYHYLQGADGARLHYSFDIKTLTRTADPPDEPWSPEQAKWSRPEALAYPFCDVCGPEDLLCTIYGEHNLARSRAYEGANTRLRRVLRNARNGRPTKIAVLGGSVTSGQGVRLNENWVYLFGQWWNETFPHPQNEIVNAAIPATGSDYLSMCFLEHIDEDVDLVFTELSINDQREEKNANSFEWLMRAVLDLPHKPAVINMQIFAFVFSMISTGGDLHAAVSTYYDVPVLSLRNMALPQILQNPDLTDHYFALNRFQKRDWRHLGKPGHKALADIAIAYSQRQLCALTATPRHQHLASDFNGTLSAIEDTEDIPRLRMLQAYDHNSTNPRAHPFCTSTSTKKHPLTPLKNNGWYHWTHESNQNKLYIVSKTPGSTITFPITVNSMGRVRLTFLRSATFGLGIVKCWIGDDKTKAKRIDGYWRHVGVNIAYVEPVADNVPIGDHILTCELQKETSDPGGGTEFRLIAVDAA